MRQVVGADLADPVVETVAVEAADHLAERADVSGGGCQMGAVSQHLLEPDLLVRSPVVRVVQHPGRDLADLGRPEKNGWDGGQRSKWLQVCAHGGVAAGVAESADLGAQLGGRVNAFLPPLVPTSAARWPPADAPPTPMRVGSMLYFSAFARSQRMAAWQSCIWAGNFAFWLKRYSTLATTYPRPS